MRAGFRDGLEAELLRRHRTLYGEGLARAAGRPIFRRARWPLLAAAAAVMLAVFLGSTPATLSMGLGELLSIELPPGTRLPNRIAVLDLLQEISGAEQISVSTSDSPSAAGHVHVVLYGTGTPAEELIAPLEAAFPALGQGRWSVHHLQADLRVSLARRIGHDLFAIEVGSKDLHEARQEILRKLAATGFDQGVDVKVTRQGNRKSIEVRLDDRP